MEWGPPRVQLTVPPQYGVHLSDFLAAQVQRNGGLENESDRRLKQLLREVDDRAEATAP
jgi:hypothetical protein